MCAAAGAADAGELPPSLARAVVSDGVALIVSPADLGPADFALQWAPGSARGLEAQLEAGSVEWVRTAHRVAAPRAVLLIRADDVDGGVVHYAGFAHPLRVVADRRGVAELPVALLSGDGNAVEVVIDRGGEAHTARLTMRYDPRPARTGEVVPDVSCSPYAVSVHGVLPDDSWMYLSCRLVEVERDGGRSAVLEVAMLWDNVGARITVNGAPVDASPQAVWSVRGAASPGEVTLQAGGRTVTLSYRVPRRLRAGFVGVGVGPYLYAYDDDAAGVAVDTIAPLLTIYAAYAWNPTLRVVYFNATALHDTYFSDQGLYLWLEQFRFFDDRVSMNLLLGLHVLAFERDGELEIVPSAPQGLELIYRDFAAANRNLSVGAFLYPEINERSYFNLWVRWGSPSIFGEINYIAWQEPAGGDPVRSQSLGVTVGFPVLRFL